MLGLDIAHNSAQPVTEIMRAYSRKWQCQKKIMRLDVVFALSSDPGLKPQICRIERRSGHKTLRLIFMAATERPERDSSEDK